MSETGLELIYDPDPSIWLVGPTESRPPEVWVPGALEVLVGAWKLRRPRQREYVEAVLTQFAARNPSPLTDRLLHWRGIEDDPFPVFVGMVERAVWPDDELDSFLRSEGEPVVEPPIVDELDAPEGVRIRRAIAYADAGDGSAVIAGVRYVVDNGDPEVVAMVHASTRKPGWLISVMGDIDALAGTVRARSTTP